MLLLFIKSIEVCWSVFCWNFYCEKTLWPITVTKKPRIFFDKLNVKRVFWSKKVGIFSIDFGKTFFAKQKTSLCSMLLWWWKKVFMLPCHAQLVSIYPYIISLHFFLRLSLFTFFLRIALSLFFLTLLHIEQWNNNDNNDYGCCCCYIRAPLVGVDGWWSKL